MTNTRQLPQAHTSSYDWQRHASCRHHGSIVFFGPDNESRSARRAREARAKTICAVCPVLTTCRQHALVAAEPYGVWGGLTAGERKHHKLAERGHTSR